MKIGDRVQIVDDSIQRFIGRTGVIEDIVYACGKRFNIVRLDEPVMFEPEACPEDTPCPVSVHGWLTHELAPLPD